MKFYFTSHQETENHERYIEKWRMKFNNSKKCPQNSLSTNKIELVYYIIFGVGFVFHGCCCRLATILCILEKHWGGGVPTLVREYSIPRLCSYFYVLSIFRPTVVNHFLHNPFFLTSCILLPPYLPPFDLSSPLYFTPLYPSIWRLCWLSTWKYPPPAGLHRPSQFFSSFTPSTCYPVSLLAPKVPRI